MKNTDATTTLAEFLTTHGTLAALWARLGAMREPGTLVHWSRFTVAEAADLLECMATRFGQQTHRRAGTVDTHGAALTLAHRTLSAALSEAFSGEGSEGQGAAPTPRLRAAESAMAVLERVGQVQAQALGAQLGVNVSGLLTCASAEVAS